MQQQNIVKAIKVSLIMQDKSQRELAKFIGEREATFNMAMKRGSLGSERIEKAAEFLGVSVLELTRLSKKMGTKSVYR